jgi:diguanylate cyclase (GGDEF)-like protein/PAS domain S-box-containing protein
MTSALERNIVEFTANRMRVRYIVALSLIATLVLVSQWVVQATLADQKHDSRVVNIAGRQRMLSQRITKAGMFLQTAETAQEHEGARAELQEALTLWLQSHRGLQHGDASLELPGENSREVDNLFQTVETDHQAMVAAAQEILTQPDDADVAPAVKRLREHERPFLRGMDAIVFQYDAEAKHKVEHARQLELGLAGITLLVLLLEARFIFAPAVRRMRHDMRRHEVHEADMERLFAASPTAMFLMDATALAIIRGNGKAEALMGCAESAYVNRSISDFLDIKFEANRGFLEKLRSGQALDEYEVVLIDARSSVVEALASACRINYSGRACFAIGITNISEIKKAQQTLKYYATFDEMTGLVNRRTGLLMLASEIDRADRDHLPLSVCFVDLDDLKAVNDQHGHHEGDWMIKAMAAVLLESIRGGDVAIRLGGDEFLLILHDCTENDATQLVERIKQRLGQVVMDDNRPWTLSASFGLALYDPARHKTPDSLIEEADNRMYMAKHGKRSQTNSNSA